MYRIPSITWILTEDLVKAIDDLAPLEFKVFMMCVCDTRRSLDELYDGYLYYSLSEIEDSMEIHPDEVIEAFKSLEEKGYLECVAIASTFLCNDEVRCRLRYTGDYFGKDYEEEESHDIEELQEIPYYEYLETSAWKAKRRQKFRQAGYRCQICNSGGTLNVHHRTYERVGNELLEDLVVLCRNCHDLFYEHGRLEEFEENEFEEE